MADELDIDPVVPGVDPAPPPEPVVDEPAGTAEPEPVDEPGPPPADHPGVLRPTPDVPDDADR